MMMELSYEQIWLLLASRNEPMTIEEIGKELSADEKEVQRILKEKKRCFRPTRDGKWSLAFYPCIRSDYPIEKIAEFILECAGFPLPDAIFIRLLKQFCPELPENEIREILKFSSKFDFDGNLWKASWWIYYIGEKEYKIIRQFLISIQNDIIIILQTIKKPIYFIELMNIVGLENKFKNLSEIVNWEPKIKYEAFIIIQSLSLQMLNNIKGTICLPSGRWIAITQERIKKVLKVMNKKQKYYTIQEILRSVLEIVCEEADEATILLELEHRLRDCEQLECIDGKWFYKKPFVSRFTFYDPETFVVMVEKDERIDVGSEKERWLKEKGFYMTARFGR